MIFEFSIAYIVGKNILQPKKYVYTFYVGVFVGTITVEPPYETTLESVGDCPMRPPIVVNDVNVSRKVSSDHITVDFASTSTG